VTFKGQPVPQGKIYFAPDGSKGNSGPTGYADVKNGSFDTSSKGGQGACSGAVVVRIEGFTEITPVGDVTTQPLFYPYEIQVDLPKGSSTQKFEVPATAADKPQKPAGGPVIIP
jgi:hypothetical protein